MIHWLITRGPYTVQERVIKNILVYMIIIEIRHAVTVNNKYICSQISKYVSTITKVISLSPCIGVMCKSHGRSCSALSLTRTSLQKKKIKK
jgi:hypothetical protein